MPSLGFGVQLLARGAGDPATSPFPSHTLLLEDGIRVEQLGFDAVWVPSRCPRLFNLTARYAQGWNMAGGGTDPAATREKYEGFAAACRSAGKDAKDFDVCKQTFVAIAPDEATKKRMTEELAVKNKVTPEELAPRTIVDTPDRMAARMRELTAVGVTHHIFAVVASDEWPNHSDTFELI